MPPKNPSEFARLEEELKELFEDLKKGTMYYSKAQKESILREIRQVERTLGIEGKSYNSEEFGK